MGDKGHSEIGFGGTINHYDEHGNKTGHSNPGFLSGYTHYDANGNKTGHSDPALFGGYNHYDTHGNKTGHSDPNGLGGFTNYDEKGNRTGRIDHGFAGLYDHSDGCYIATCIYGSYDCPNVWALRRFRDDILALNFFGRTFIRTYYAVSPITVKLFGKTKLFKSFWRKYLDKLISELLKNGIANTPYADINWRTKK